MTPWQKKDTEQNYMLPCGKCPECTSRRISAWSFRLMQEVKRATSAHFLTLTYDTQHVPISKHGFMSLDKRHVQLFMKKLRKAHGKSTIKYYCAGEYGGRTKRPHYHIIIFNARIDLLQPAWDKGAIHYGTVEGASIGYTLKYISKQRTIPMHSNDDRIPEFAIMSKRLGDNYLTKAAIDWHKKDLENRMHLTIEDGKKVSMPRYYKEKIYNDDERQIIAQAHIMRISEQIEKFNTDPNYEKNFRNREAAILAAFHKQNLSSKQKDKL